MEPTKRTTRTALRWLQENYKTVYDEYKQHELNRKRERARVSVRKLREKRKNNPAS